MERDRVHYVITKYNLSLYSDPETLRRIGGDPDEWMSQRFKLFSTITLPSLKGQSCQSFSWFLFVDATTPSRFKTELEDVANDYAPMEIVYLGERQVDFLRRKVAASGAQVAITSRIDNDDAWHSDYVRYVQQEKFPIGSLVDFQDSYWLDVRSKQVFLCTSRWWTDPRWWRSWRTLLRPRISNSPTTIESAAGAKTVLADVHRGLLEHFGRDRIHLIPNKPYRLVTCHGRNLLNEIGGREGRFDEVSADVLEDFHVTVEL